MFMRKRYLLLSLVFCLLIYLFSCNERTMDVETYGYIKGNVINSQGNSPMEGVSISTNPGTNAVASDVDGNFDLGRVKVGDYTIVATREEYRSANINVSLVTGQKMEVTIIMQLAPEEKSTASPPINLAPEDHSEEHNVSVELQWHGDDPDDGDTLRYDVWVYTPDKLEGEKVVENILDTTYIITDLQFDTPYYWKVVARNKSLEESEGTKWSFRTREFPPNRYFFVRAVEENYEIFSTNLSELDTVQLTHDPNPQFQPRLSPTRELIAFSSYKGDNFHIMTMKTNGRDIFQVTSDHPLEGNHNNQGMGFCWSPTGEYILYPHNGKLFRINPNGSGDVQFASAPQYRDFIECHWSKYGNRIVVLTQGKMPYDNEIYLMNDQGGEMTLLVDNLPGTIGGVCFTEDGKKVLFTHDVSELSDRDDGRQLDTHIFSIDLDGANLTDLSGNKTDGTLDLYPRNSPDGAKIIFVNTPNDGLGPSDIYVMDVAGGNREKIITNGQMPEWR